MGDDPEHEPQQEAIVLNDATSSEQIVTAGIESAGSETRQEQGHDESQEDAPVQETLSTNTEERKELSIDTHAVPNGREEDATDQPEGQQHADAHDEAGHEGSALSTPVETPSVGSEHAATSMSAFPAGAVHPGHPKKFVSSANINKKFLQKTATPTPPPAPGKGAIPTIARPASVTPAQSQSRLVTTKLTMVAPALPTASAGWNKSNTPSGAPSPQPAATPLSSQVHTPASTPAGAHPNASAAALQSASIKLSNSALSTSRPGAVPAGTSVFAASPVAPAARAGPAVMQMQAPAQTSVWGHPAPTASLVPVPSLAVEGDFPTAAEAARGKRPRLVPSHKAEAHPPPLADTSADAFRGVHLDPNAHHWDDLEDEEDDFLAGEVEFGDGRQYKVEAVESVEMEHPPATAIPVTRENRFSDDFDRSWPRTAPLPPPPDLSRSGPQTSPTTDSARALFNERSNRLEPWGRAAPPHQQPGRRRESFDEHRGGFPGRDAPPHTNVHVLQKESRNAPFPPREPQPLPPHPGRQAGPPSGMIRQLPPHLSQPPLAREPLPSAVGSGRPPPHTATSPESASTTIPALPPPHLATSISTAPDSASLKSLSPDVTSSPALPSSAVDVGELHKMAMHSAAERAKRRRQEEEEERERERERARRKAQEIEERVKAAELEKHREAERQREAARAEQERRAAQEKQAASERRAHAESASAASGSDLRSAQAMPLRPPPVLGSTGRSPELPSMRADSWRSIKPLGPIGTPITPSALEKPPSPATPHTPHSHTIFSPIVSTIPEVLAISSTDDVEEVDFAEMGRLTNGMSDATPRGGLSHVRPYSERVPLANQRSDVGPWRRGSQSATMNPAHAINGASQLISSEPESFSTLPSEVFVLEDEVASAEEAPIPRVSVPGAAPVRPNMHSPPTHHLKPAYREPAMSALDDTMSRIKGALGAMQEARSNVPVENMAQELTVAPVAARHSTPVMLKPLETTTHVDRPVSPPLAWRSFSVRVPKKSLKLGPVPTSRLHDFLQVPPPASMDILSWVPPVKDMSIRTLSRDDLFHRKTYTRGVVNARVLLPSHHFVPYERPPPLPVVRLPSSLNQDAPLVASAVPRVLLPKSRVSSLAPRDVPHEARQRFVDSLSRPPAVLSSDGFMTDDLKLTSRSPPPDLSYPLSPPSEHSATGRSLSDNPNGIPPQRVPRKMPEGVNLILYKSPSRSDVTAGDGSSVRFTVSSELDGQPSLEHTLAQASTISPRRLTMDLTGQADRRIRGNDLGGEGGLHFMDGSGSTKSSEDSMSSLLSTVGPVATGSTSMPSPEFDNIKSATNATPTKTSVTPASGMTPNPWGKALLPDPEHLKAVWSHPGTSKITENSLKGISDEFPATLPVSVQELRSEDEDVPSVKNADELPTPAVTEPPVRPSFFDPHKSFQQVPAQPVSSSARFVPPPPVNYSATGVHGHTPYGGLGNAASTRPGPVTHAGVRPFPSYAPIVPGHSPSPPIMYTNASPYTMVSHGVPQTISPNMQQRIWVPQQGSPAASYVTTSTPYTPGMMPYGAPGTGMGRPYQPLAPGSKAPGGERPMLLHNPSMTHANSIGTHVSPPYHPVAGMEQMPGFSPPVHNALPQTHVGYTPHQANPPQQMYSVPIGGGRGAVRNTYDGYQPVPSGAFVRPSGW